MSHPILTKDDWSRRWDTNQAFWHLQTPHPDLVAYSPLLAERKRILVPLCGKTVDLIFLAQHGHEVVGIEYVDSAVQEYFKEHEAILGTCTREQVTDNIVRYTSASLPVTVFSADIFDTNLTADLIGGKCDGMFDRGSLVALNRTDRVRYFQQILNMTLPQKSPLSIILNCVSYPQSTKSGPPFALTYDDICRLLNCTLNGIPSDDKENANDGVKFSTPEDELAGVKRIVKETTFAKTQHLPVNISMKFLEERDNKERGFLERAWLLELTP